jgi:mono/diheme cytochrome c family protein
MKRSLGLLLLPILTLAQDDKVAQGSAVYRASCGVAYCHGPEGKPGRAPRLAGRKFDAATIVADATQGIPNTSMPAFGGQLKPEDIEAVAAYIVSLDKSETDASAQVKVEDLAAMPAAVSRGRTLFFDAARIGNCGTCHEVGGRGVPVSVALADLRSAHLDNPGSVETPGVVTARPIGEDPFPAVVVEKTLARVRVYDLSSGLPVLRTFAAAEVALTAGSSWRHSDAADIYSAAELEAVTRYLRWAAAH